MMMMMVHVPAAGCLRQILNVRKRVVLRGIGKVSGKLVELAGLGGIAIGGGRVGRVLEIGRNLRGHLLVLGGVRLLKLLERAQHLGERRELAVVGSLADAAETVPVGFGCQTGALEGGAENRL